MVMVSVGEAAAELGISVRQVQRLVRAGELRGVGPNRLEWESVLQRQALRREYRRRAWSEVTAWAAVAVLADTDLRVDWVGQAQRSRLKKQLFGMSAAEFVGHARNRARIYRLRGHRSAIARVAGEVVVSGSGRAIGGLAGTAGDVVDGYVDAGRYADLVARLRLSEADAGSGNVILRVTGFDLGLVATIATAGDVLAAVDLSGSLDARERSAGLAVLGEQLERVRRLR